VKVADQRARGVDFFHYFIKWLDCPFSLCEFGYPVFYGLAGFL
jgi:hypothetical protein